MPRLFPPENLQRVGFLAFLPGVLRRLETDPAEVLAAAGLSAQALDDPEATIPYAAMGRLAEIAAQKTRCPHFGLEIGKQIRTSSLGLLGELMRNAPTLKAALLDFATNQHRNAHGGVAYLLTDKHHAIFGYAVYQPHVSGSHVICDGAAMGCLNLVCELAGTGHVPVTELLFTRPEPSDLTPYHRALSVKLRFSAEQTAILLPRSLLDRPVAGADAEYRKIIEKRVSSLWHAGELDTVTRLRRALRVALISGRISADEISAQLGMSRRTLHRRLNTWGLRFQEVLNETRCEFAQQLLANTRLDIAEIGTIVGYSDPSVLTRGFTRWAGMPPSEWRSNIQNRRDA